MAKTVAEKILSKHAGLDLKAGDFAFCNVDFAFSQDGTSSIVIDRLKDLGIRRLKTRFCMVIDHNAPSPTIGTSSVHQRMRDFAHTFGVPLFDIGSGVCHQVISESDFVHPGDLVLGADSHTTTLGVLGAFASGVGSSDVALTLATGKNWFRVPETYKIIIKGKKPFGVFAKDIILYIISDLKADGATYRAIEFYGSVIERASLESRLTIANMVVEMGAKCCFMPTAGICADDGAKYERTLVYDISQLQPQVALAHSVDSARPVSQLKSIKIDEAYLGTCTNGRLSDLLIAARILKGRRIKEKVKFIVAPASRAIFLEALKRGIIETLIKAGAVLVTPGCGPCVGTHNGVPADGERVISTANRNFKGRMGNPHAEIFLASPAVVVASAIEGRIADPRKYLS
ncbi:MAG: 3-isopropylmalate dehydratase large subunit [Candidatus Omnitrophica bacterium]|nr:3-isopropylmalate dehydratase large subunit [Candidatus Omnitrophota bacterium]